MKRPFLIALVAFAFHAGASSAAVVVLANGASEAMPFTLAPDAGKPIESQLAVGESKAFPCDKEASIAFGPKEQPTTLKLEAYSVYVFTNRNKSLELTGIALEGQSPAGALPKAELSAKVPAVSVTLLADDSERRTRAVWEPILKKRFAQAAAIVEAHAGVRFELAEVSTWDADPMAMDLASLHADFAKVVAVKPGSLAVGYTGRRFDPKPGDAMKPTPFAAPVLALQSHVLIREREPKTEAERVEVLVQQLGRYLGAIAVPDRSSVLRPRLGDGQAVQTRFRIGFDPLNTLAMNLVADDLRSGQVRTFGELTVAAQARLGRIYGTVRTAMPDEPLPDAYLVCIERAGIAAKEAAAPAVATTGVPKPAELARPRTPKEDAVRAVILAIAARAEENAKVPAGVGSKLRGDELASDYVRAAATAAGKLDKAHREPAFLLALGVALDDSSVLRDNPITASFCKAVESDDERKRRLAVLGNPTIRNRRDLCQHFVVSACLTEMAGPELAETAGLMKEQADMTKASGFSFADLAADFAGIEFAKRVKANPETLASVGDTFKVSTWMPSIDGLRDGISAPKFKAEFVSTTNVNFKTAYDAVWKRVRDLPVHADK